MNAIPLIRRKLVPPRLPEPYVHRQKLLSALQMGLEPSRRLSLVCAGPGYGKSTLVAAYLDELDVPACWYALEETDSDLTTFLSYLVGAVAARFPGLSGRVMELVRSAPVLEPVVQTAIGLLAEEMAGLAEDGAVLVLDDFHAVGHAPAIAKTTEHLVQYLPDNWQLILISREMPPLPLPQLRVRQQLVELGVRELRFVPGELRELLARLTGLALTDAEALDLVGHTDGWVASVILAAQAVSGSGEDAKALLMRELGQPQALYEYLAQEVFSHQSPEMQAFLLETSLLPQVDATLCREALGREDAPERIRALIQGNLLLPQGLEAAGARHEGHGYHPSFRRFLEDRLNERESPERVAALCKGIGECLAETQPEEALGYYMRAGELAAAAQLLDRMAEGLLANNQVDRLRAAIDRFPADYPARSFALSFHLGEIQRLWGGYDQALGHFERAAELAADAPGLRGRALVHQAAIWLLRGDSQAAALLEEGERLLASADFATRSFAANLRGAAAMATNESDAAMRAYEEALAGYRRTGDALGQAKVLNNLGQCYTRFGQFDAAIGTYREAVAQSERAGRYPHPMILNNLAFLHCYQGQFQEAWAAAERALDVAQLLKTRRDELYALLGLGTTNMGLGDARRAEEHFSACRDGALSIKDRALAGKAYAALAELAHRAGENERALALLEAGVEQGGLPISDPRQGDLAILLGLLHLELGRHEEAEALLARLEGEYAALGYRYREAQVAFYRARSAERQGLEAGHWARAEALARAHGYEHLLAEESRHRGAAPAVAEVAPQGPAPAITIQCFGSMQVTVGDRAVPNRDWRGFKTKLILAYLLAHPAGVTKEQLTDLLYAEIDTTRTATLVLISRLRHALESDLDKQTPSRFIHFLDGRYTFNFAMPYKLDTQDFEYHARRGADAGLPLAERRSHWQASLSLYHGPFLGDLTVDCPWLTIEQERYRRMAQEAHSALIRAAIDEGDAAAALAAAEANLAFDACCELAHQVKMACLARLGQRQGAIRHFAIMKQIFDRELGSPPSRETEALAAAISQGRDVPLAGGTAGLRTSS